LRRGGFQTRLYNLCQNENCSAIKGFQQYAFVAFLTQFSARQDYFTATLLFIMRRVPCIRNNLAFKLEVAGCLKKASSPVVQGALLVSL